MGKRCGALAGSNLGLLGNDPLHRHTNSPQISHTSLNRWQCKTADAVQTINSNPLNSMRCRPSEQIDIYHRIIHLMLEQFVNPTSLSGSFHSNCRGYERFLAGNDWDVYCIVQCKERLYACTVSSGVGGPISVYRLIEDDDLSYRYTYCVPIHSH